MKEDIAIDNLHQVKEVLDKYGIEFWLDSGVLLGIMRNGHLIPWDNDIDLCIWYNDAPKISLGTSAYDDFCSRNFDLYFLDDKIVVDKKDCPVNISLFHLTDEKAVRPPYLLYGSNPVGKFLRNLWWLFSVSYYGKIFKTKKTMLVKLTQILPINLRKKIASIILKISKKFGCREITWSVPKHFFTNLSEINFHDMGLKIPSNVSEYLTFRYGNDWITPKRNWDSLARDGAVEKKT